MSIGAAMAGAGGEKLWRVFADTGGTFTDCLAIDPAGTRRRAKVLSSSSVRGRIVEVLGPRRLALELSGSFPESFFAGCVLRALAGGGEAEVVGSTASSGRQPVVVTLAEALGSGVEAGEGVEVASPDEAPVLAARMVTATPHGRPLPPMALRLATTRGTNALLERRGAPTALCLTRGFADLLVIGTQQRPDLFALEVVKPEPLYERAVEVDERLAADGSVLVPLDEPAVERMGRALVAAGIECAAVAFLHSYRNPEHEQAAERALRRAGLRQVSISSRLAPVIRILPRAETALVDAYLGPVIGDYLRRVAGALEGGTGDAEDGGEWRAAGSVHVMTSAGGLVRADSFSAKDSLLSGPAGGVVGAVSAGRRSGLRQLIAFDMGGTSTDVSRYGGEELEYVYEHRVGEAHLVAPALAIETVAAGGGSICGFDGDRLTVGPQSAGASPGPACYGAGGPLTVTDVNLLLGRLEPARFGIPIDPAAARRAARELADQVGERVLEPMLAGFLDIANERMADAIRSVSLRRGYDPADHALVAFGGAGGQHACAVADLLGIRRALVPTDAGLLSAVGLGAAVVERFAQRQVLAPLGEVAERLSAWLDELAAEASRAVESEGIDEADVEVRRRLVSLRLLGQDSAIELEPALGCTLAESFARRYREIYGYGLGDRPLEVESIRVIASSRSEPSTPAGGEPRGDAWPAPTPTPAPTPAPTPESHRRIWRRDGWAESVALYRRRDLRPGMELPGPAMVTEDHCATWLDAGWVCRVGASEELLLEAQEPGPGTQRVSESPS